MTTRIADVIVPEVFNPYVVRKSLELSALVQSGIVVNDAEFNTLASAAARTVNMPYWNDLSGADEVLSDTEGWALTPGGIDAEADIAVILRRGRAWARADLAASLAGDDPMGAIAGFVAEYWARRYQAALLSTLAGIFAAASMSGNLHDISGEVGAAAIITADGTIDASQKLGDAKAGLSGILMHSAVNAKLAKDDLIEYTKDSQGNIAIPTYLGKRVIVDDSCPVAGGDYTTYLFGPGAIALGLGSPVGFIETETDRDKLAGEDILINRKTLVVHPRGVAFQSDTVAGVSPTNAELEIEANWVRVYDAKAIRIVAFKHRIAADES